jgi:hypothetical protein
MEQRTYTINELKTLIFESASEIKAKVGDGVNSTNKKESSSTYKNTKEKIKNFDGGGDEMEVKRNLPDKVDGNKTTLDYEYDGKLDKNFRDKVKSQAEGYTSSIEKKNKIEKIGDFDDKTYQQFKKAGVEMSKNKVAAKKAGLTARELPDSAFEKENVYETKKISVLNFKNTTFLNESHMISRIPDDYKVDGKRFKVKDSAENEFIVEWKEGEPNILSYENKRKINESLEKFHKLSGYNSTQQFKKSSNQSRLNENNEFNKILNKTRTITENQNK